MYCLCVNVYCHRVTTQLQLTNISYHIISWLKKVTKMLCYLFKKKKFCGLIRIRKTQTKRTDHYGRSRRNPAVTRNINCCFLWLQDDHTWFGDHFMSSTISMLQVVHDRCFLSCLEKWKPWFGSRPIHLGFVVEKVALGTVFLRLSRFSTVRIIKSTLHTHVSFI